MSKSLTAGFEASGHPLGPVKSHRLIPGVGDAVQCIARAVHNRAGPHLRDLSVALDFAGAVRNDENLFFRMLMRRVGTGPRIEQRHAGADRIQLVRWTVIVDINRRSTLNRRLPLIQNNDAVLKFLCGALSRDNVIDLCHRPIIRRSSFAAPRINHWAFTCSLHRDEG